MKSKFTFFLCLMGLFSLNVSAQSMGFMPVDENEYARLPKAPMLEMPADQGDLNAYDLSAYMPPVGNQGTLNTSAAYSACYAIKSYQEMIEENATSYLVNDRIDGNRVFSPAFVQNTLTDGNPEQSVSLVQVLNDMRDVGCVKWNDFPTYWENNKEWNYNASKPSHSLQKRASKYRIKDWYSLGGRNDIGIMEVKGYLRNNYPVLLGVNIDEGFTRLNANYPIWDHQIGNITGSHSMVIVGFDDNMEVNQIERGAFKVLNSWGVEWGMGGYCWISYNHFRNVAMEAYIMEDDINREYISHNNNQNNGGVTINVYETYYNNQVVLYPIYIHTHHGYLNHYPVFYQSYCPVFQNNYYSGYCQGYANGYNNGYYNGYTSYNNYGGGYCYYNNVVVVNNTTINNTTVNNTTVNNTTINHNDYTHNTQMGGSGAIKHTDLAPQHPIVEEVGTAPAHVTAVSQVVPPKRPRSIAEIPHATANSASIQETNTPKTSTNMASFPSNPKNNGLTVETPKTNSFSNNPKTNAEVTPKSTNFATSPQNTESSTPSSHSFTPKTNTPVVNSFPKSEPVPVTPKPSYSAPSQPVTPKSSYAAPSQPVTPKSSYVAPSQPVTPKSSYAAPSQPVTPKSSYVAPSQPVTPKSSYSAPSQPVTPKSSYAPPSQPVTPKPSYSAPSQPVTPKSSYVAPSQPVTPKPSYSAPKVNDTPRKSYSEPTHYEAPKSAPVHHYEAPAPVRHSEPAPAKHYEAPVRHSEPAHQESHKSAPASSSGGSAKKGH